MSNATSSEYTAVPSQYTTVPSKYTTIPSKYTTVPTKYTTIPSAYTTDHAPSVLRTHTWRTAQNSASYLLPYLSPSSSILDIGCGPGSITISFAQLVPKGHVTGIEPASSPLESARSLASRQNVTNVTFEVGDVHALPYADNTFDVVHAHQVLQHISSPVLALREMRRVCKQGGIIACRESASMSWHPPSAGLSAWLSLSENLGRRKGGNPHPGSHIHVWARDAGCELKDISRSAGTWCFSTDEERAYWGGSMEERCRSSGFVNMAKVEGLATDEELEAIARGWKEWREDETAWFGVLHGEVICRKSV